MVNITRQKNTKVLSTSDIIELLTMMKIENLHTIAKHFNITLRAVQYQKRRYGAYSDDKIDQVIHRLENKLVFQEGLEPDFPHRDYKRQEGCEHIHATFFMKCHCTLTIGENNIDQVIEILERRRDYMKSHQLVQKII